MGGVVAAAGAELEEARRRAPDDVPHQGQIVGCLLYTSDAADERSSVDLGGRRIIKKKNTSKTFSSVNKENQ